MKKYLLLTSIFINYGLPCLCFSQSNHFSLDIDVPGMQSGYAKLLIEGVSLDKDKAYKWKVENGKVLINGILPQSHPYLGWIWLNDSIRTGNFIVSPRQGQRIAIDRTAYGSLPVDTSYLGQDNQALNEELDLFDKNEVVPFYAQRESTIKQAYQNNPPERVIDSLNNVLKGISLKKDEVIKNYILENPGSYVGLLYLYDRVGVRGYSTVLENGLQSLPKNLQNSDLGKKTREMFIKAEKTSIGRIFPQLELRTDKQAPVKLDLSSSGKTNQKLILIDFWYSNCGPCIGQFDALKSMYSKYHKTGFDIISISTDSQDKMKAWENVIARYSLAWKQYLDMDGNNAEKLNINFYPFNFLVDNEGKILDKNVSMVQLKEILGKELD